MRFLLFSLLILIGIEDGNALTCNYEGKLYNICANANAWSYENGAVCVGITRCVSQSPPYGVTTSALPPKTSTTIPTPTTPSPTTPTPTTPPPTTPTPTTLSPPPLTPPSTGLRVGTYRIINQANGLCMDVADQSTSDGGKLITYACSSGALNQQFELGTLSNGYSVLVSTHSGKSLDVWEHVTAPGAEIRQYTYMGTPNQHWTLQDVGGGYYRIIARLGGLSMSAWCPTCSNELLTQHTYNEGVTKFHWKFEPVGKTDYRLVWSEEFDYTGLPTESKWNYEVGMVRNNEAQYYTRARPENVDVRNGQLTITARRENYESAKYTSASITTGGKAEWTYGRFEMRARIDARAGLWPAFWMVGPGKWPEGGEIDIMEYYNDKILANVAWKANNNDAWSASWSSSTRSMSILRSEDPDWSNQYHIWRMDWDEKVIRLYVDGVLMRATNLDNTRNPDGSNPFRGGKFHFLVNLAIGGNNGGDPSGTSFPSKYEIDYIRVYQ